MPEILSTVILNCVFTKCTAALLTNFSSKFIIFSYFSLHESISIHAFQKLITEMIVIIFSLRICISLCLSKHDK